jgi:MFS family permease/HAMP domain-containing protein
MVKQLLWDIAYDVVTVLIVATIVALGLMRLLLALSVSIPLRALHEFLAGIASGDFRRYLPRDFFGGIGELNRRINRIVGDLNAASERLRSRGQPAPGGFMFHDRGESHVLSVSAIDHIQWPFFLLIFADSLSLSFFPLFVGQFYDPSLGLPKEVVIGVPISLFMLVWALAMPWAGLWCDRVGYRRAFAAGAAVTTVGLILTAYAQGIVEVMLWRSLTAIGYGAVFVTAQAYISANTPPAERTRGMALFLTSFFAGSLSGAAIGGIMVDRLGYQLTFLLSALLSSAAVLFVMRFVRHDSGLSSVKKTLRPRDFGQLLKHRHFATITFLAAVPAKIVLTGFLYYSVPLYLSALGNDQAGTGRTMMAYGLAIILVSPAVAGLADRLGHRRWFVVMGGYVAALAVASLCFLDGILGVALSVTFVGIAHAIGVPPQLALVSDSCEDVVGQVGQAASAGIFRLMERLGNVAGPILFGLLIAFYDFKGAFGGIAVLLFVVTTVFALLLLWFDRTGAQPTANRAL